jgi:hypothetical protein
MTITSAAQVYQFVEKLKAACIEHNEINLFSELEHAMQLGSSGLEIMGAICKAIIHRENTIGRILGTDGKKELNHIVEFVDRAYGRTVSNKNPIQ